MENGQTQEHCLLESTLNEDQHLGALHANWQPTSVNKMNVHMHPSTDRLRQSPQGKSSTWSTISRKYTANIRMYTGSPCSD